MVLIVGLGNPGKEFQRTRHNVGFMIVESLKLKVKSFSDWKNIKKLQAEISKGEIDGQKILLAKPRTFMNNSGKAVKRIILNLKSERSPLGRWGGGRVVVLNLFVIHDDIDLPLGKIRISKGRGSAGHKGVESIIRELGMKNFVRFRIGIQPRSTISTIVENIDRFVLQKFNKAEEKAVKDVVKKTVEAIEFVIKEGLEKAMSKFNR